MLPSCWLKQFTPPQKERACEGRMDRAHLIAQQVLRREGHEAIRNDPRLWVPACRRHHTLMDDYVLVVPREALPQDFLALADELGLGWYVDRRFGAQSELSRLEDRHLGDEAYDRRHSLRSIRVQEERDRENDEWL